MSDIELLTPAEYAELRRCSLRTLDRERAVGRGCPYVRLGARILYRRSDIERHIETHIRGTGRDVAVAAALQPRRRGRLRKNGAVP